jgi:hypothetical protein
LQFSRTRDDAMKAAALAAGAIAASGPHPARQNMENA